MRLHTKCFVFFLAFTLKLPCPYPKFLPRLCLFKVRPIKPNYWTTIRSLYNWNCFSTWNRNRSTCRKRLLRWWPLPRSTSSAPVTEPATSKSSAIAPAQTPPGTVRHNRRYSRRRLMGSVIMLSIIVCDQFSKDRWKANISGRGTQ